MYRFRNLALIGFMGAGKTAVGKALSRELGFTFIDLDHRVERLYGKTIPEIFEEKGEGHFRELESKVLSRLEGLSGTVVSTGGGAWMRSANRRILRQLGPCIWLDAGLDTLWKRVSSKLGQRPLLGRDLGAKARMKSLYSKRKKTYALADLRVRTDGRTPSEVSRIILGKLSKLGAVKKTGSSRSPSRGKVNP